MMMVLRYYLTLLMNTIIMKILLMGNHMGVLSVVHLYYGSTLGKNSVFGYGK